jgi:predicted nucleic acid-binding Zn ribbon protein
MQEMKSVEHCPVCGSDSFRHFTAHPLMFKARGFPSNDNRKKSRGKQVVDSKVEDLFDDHKWKKKYGV